MTCREHHEAFLSESASARREHEARRCPECISERVDALTGALGPKAAITWQDASRDGKRRHAVLIDLLLTVVEHGGSDGDARFWEWGVIERDDGGAIRAEGSSYVSRAQAQACAEAIARIVSGGRS